MVKIRAKAMVSSECEGGTIYHSKICSGGTISALIKGAHKNNYCPQWAPSLEQEKFF